MGPFATIDIAATGSGVAQLWLETISHNLANVNTVRNPEDEPFRAFLVHAEERTSGRGGTGEGVYAVQLLRSEGEPPWVWDPDHPLASEEGYVVRPVIDVAGQMADLIVAQRSYQMNLEVIRTGEEAYQSALRIGSPQ